MMDTKIITQIIKIICPIWSHKNGAEDQAMAPIVNKYQSLNKMAIDSGTAIKRTLA